MIGRLKPYSDYKDSGLPWLGQVPQHWKNAPGFAAFREKQVKNIGLQEKRVLSLSYGRIIIKPLEKLHGLVPDSFETYQIVEPDDIIIRSTDLQNDKTSLRIGMVRDRGIITSAYICMKTTEAMLPEFGYQLLNTHDLCKVLYGMGSGLRQNLEWTDFKRMPVFLPPLVEQTAIVRFLDYATRRLDKAIRAKRKTIALLNEQKQAIIHRAVTRGLNPDAPLKDSGIPWLGQIPAHWKICRVKDQFFCLNPRRIPLSSVERGAMTSQQYDYYGASGVIDKVEDFLFDDELLLIAEDGANLVLRNLPLAIVARGKFWVNNHAHILKPKGCNLEYMAGYMETLNYQPWISGAAQPKLTKDRLMSIAIAVASVTEQSAIIQHYTEQTQPLISTIKTTEREITLLREYRTRLIADVVTGKLDVREAAARLPDESAALEEITTTLEDEGLDESTDELSEAEA